MNLVPSSDVVTPSWLKISVMQFKPQLGQKNANLIQAKKLTKDTNNSALLVLPEMCTTGYTFNSRQSIEKLAEPSLGDSFDFFSQIARKNNQYITYGYPENYAGVLYNSQNLINPNGNLIGTYRKINLFSTDQTWATRGNLGYITVNSEIGRIGLGICMDMNFDSFTNYHIACNSDIVAISSCWLEGKDSTLKYWATRWFNYQGIVAISNICGVEQGKLFSGHSCIIDNSTIVAHCPQNSAFSLVTEHKFPYDKNN